MKNFGWGSIALMVATVLLATSGAAMADPGEARLTSFLDVGNLLRETGPGPLRASSGLAPLLQDEGWGWGEEEKKPEKKPEEKNPGEKKPEEKPAGGDDWGWGEEKKPEEKKPAEKPPEKKDDADWGEEKKPEEKAPGEKKGGEEGWGEGGGAPKKERGEGKKGDGGWGEESWGEEGASSGTEPGAGEGEGEGPETGEGGREEDTGPTVNYARKTRIGLEIGGFLPMGAKEAPYSTGQFAGLFLGFSLGSLPFTTEVRFIEGYTTSTDQEKGFDMTTILVGGRLDFLLHFMPKSQSFNLFFFLGAGAVVEMSSGTGEDPVSGKSLSESGTYPGFLVDAGLGAWFSLSGSIDLFLRLEFDLIPVSQNVSYFGLGEIGLQMKF
jgi:hypothetical protein